MPRLRSHPTPRWDRIALLALVSAQLIYLGFHLIYGRFIGWDEIGYKAVGRAWAETGRWIAPELEGAYWPLAWRCRPPGPPLYNLAFGLFLREFGLSLRTNAAFDALIQVALSWVCFAVARVLDRDGPSWPAAIAAIAILPLGNPGRPEAMGMLFGFSGWLLTKREPTSTRHWLAAGALNGLAASTSLAGGVFIGLLVLLRRTRLRNAAVWIGVSAAVFLPIMLLINWTNLTSASGGMTNMATAAASRSWRTLLGGFSLGRSAGWGMVATLVPLVFGWRHRSLWLVPLAIQLAIPLLFPREFYYIFIMSPVMLAIAMNVIRRSPYAALVATLAFPVYLFAISRVLLLHVVLATLPPDQRIEPNLRLIRSIIPKTSTVMTYDYWPALASEYRLFSTDARPPWQAVDYIVLTGNGSGTPGQRQSMSDDHDEHVRHEYKVIVDRLNRQPFHLGPIHTNSAYGFGPLILERIRRPGESNESAHVRTVCWP
jgi:hypothetical protein